MIEEIRISDLGVIGDATLELGPGFTVVTGETGAGKTMIVTALGLLLGARADAGSVRRGASSAVVEGRWDLPDHAAVAERVEDAGGTVEDGELILTRTVSAEGRSRATVGGRSAPVAVLGELADQLVTVHGQSDQIRLTSASAQRAALDGFGAGAIEKALAKYVAVYDAWQQHAGDLETLTRDRDERLAEAARLREASEEIEAADPQPGEDTELAERAERLGNLEELRLSAGLAHEAVSSESLDGPDVIGLVESARRAIERVANVDQALQPVLEQLTELGIQASEASASLSSYIGSLEPEAGHDLELVNERRALLAGLTRKYGDTVEDVIAYGQRASDRLLELDGDDDRIVGLQQAVEADLVALEAAAATLTKVRSKAATDLAKRVTAELKSLAMAGATLVVEVTDAGEFRRHGRDQVAILLQPHSGTDPRPIGKGASGGELSRVMLAIEVVMAGSTTVPTFVFDEVDAGVGGAAAIEIGRRLAALAERTQVIVVTHLAQVAAFANNHLNVVKDASGAVTSSSVRRLEGDDRLQEMARLLSGLGDSASGMEHARELLEVAGRSA
ncbi:DNA repair protein RecN [Curtobacterium sp. MCJR17_055]|uniref:DNA repair protein RecN n=1 Tax=unclassified Curtobacterium TaxID=257496 RepID=UPI000D94A4E8|nr:MULTISPECIES: DNA repair protein RecN [unclassified Curtobacterium]PYY33249.1 DNA repair protein RecN [Curtobacterium sp. MCBD17_029]PYY47470.1 DNA repair protein RecN [Curtobacterium sp. MCBD17_023]PYY53192.1 DNA repair protein RecN [Curtobacterium sp. MCJR17_055]PYY56347.1 DNA repair protein RecN [Curtobacterium sp. MCPF17_015]WIB15085.1 DNA repair protein RecN [Curtobacterium sp. MCPF17_050]